MRTMGLLKMNPDEVIPDSGRCPGEKRALDITSGVSINSCLNTGNNWPFQDPDYMGDDALVNAKFNPNDGYAIYFNRNSKPASLFGDDLNGSVLNHSVSLYEDKTRDGMVEACCTITAILDDEGEYDRRAFWQVHRAVRTELREVLRARRENYEDDDEDDSRMLSAIDEESFEDFFQN